MGTLSYHGGRQCIRFSQPTRGPALKPGCQAAADTLVQHVGLTPAVRLLTKYIRNLSLLPTLLLVHGPLKPMGHILKAFEWPSGGLPVCLPKATTRI